MSNSISRATRIWKNLDFIPSKEDDGFQKWEFKGPIYIGQGFDAGEIQTRLNNLKNNSSYQHKTLYFFYKLEVT